MPVSRYAVFGHPVAHSLSPAIHADFGKQTGIVLDYTAIDAPPEDFSAALQRFADGGGKGANVTLPLKEAACALASSLSDRARLAGAVNTLVRHEGQWQGENTDGIGLVRDLTDRHGLDLRGRRVLLLGAGGAARGVAPALLQAGITEMVVVNRSPERADALCDTLGEPGRVVSRYIEDLRDLGDFELIVNATAAGRDRDAGAFAMPLGLVNSLTAAVDLNYGATAIAFLAWARSAQCRYAIDGLGMLVEQAAESFALWHGVRPDTDPVYAALRAREAVLVSAD
ncbi:shikimate dehydrogenase [Xanthomonas oryzae pv. oryzae]|uniref:Shikimate dehydrogenase (NADP(+)) n=10 Tax=Xanthomonas oryzae TaxID=347 RepID=AROE_XANOM|nr:shikimate dehydrogenase [Xanthomonas oryzae]Q2P8K0.1 RecName: Full=Shikimate dehydrogenase (NADP(+)); Short=SDH [Xanthomonas oryzae pv. oryzae MAFF 311018]ABJ89862.1 shikimate dehydrogenase [Xanthomonas oryzae pv. oryzae KACC 10331]AJQ85114.1 shikimate 5-dehydrogenase [Xanthomonas oryzae pv. oryzae PXO86]ALZ73687.1 shikimate dehydrogenase [Xanthomonas oryzae pv. oryzae]AOS00981.1 shikimate dehydrogenase [Xanthomonas oryzae pv. oryzae]AOS08313.1 shikimate dehydrogenase [Xanthomonas oryzae p